MKLNTSQKYCWNELLGKALTTQEMRLSLFSLAVFCAPRAVDAGAWYGSLWEWGDLRTPAPSFAALPLVLYMTRLGWKPLATVSRHPNPD